MAFVDWYELKHHQAFGAFGNILNVYHFERQGALTDAALINQAFLDTVIPTLRALQVTSVTHTLLETQNLGVESDFQSLSLSGLGGTGGAGEGAPSFAASRIQFLRERTDMKHGWKRFAGIAETALNFNTLQGTYPTTLENLGQLIVDGLETAAVPGTTVARYGIIARICAEVDAGGVCLSYRMPENDAELEFYYPSQFIARTTIGSQNTRK